MYADFVQLAVILVVVVGSVVVWRLRLRSAALPSVRTNARPAAGLETSTLAAALAAYFGTFRNDAYACAGADAVQRGQWALRQLSDVVVPDVQYLRALAQEAMDGKVLPTVVAPDSAEYDRRALAIDEVCRYLDVDKFWWRAVKN